MIRERCTVRWYFVVCFPFSTFRPHPQVSPRLTERPRQLDKQKGKKTRVQSVATILDLPNSLTEIDNGHNGMAFAEQKIKNSRNSIRCKQPLKACDLLAMKRRSAASRLANSFCASVTIPYHVGLMNPTASMMLKNHSNISFAQCESDSISEE